MVKEGGEFNTKWQKKDLSFYKWTGSKMKCLDCFTSNCSDCDFLSCSKCLPSNRKHDRSFASCLCGNENNSTQSLSCKCLDFDCMKHMGTWCTSCLPVCHCLNCSCSDPTICPTIEVKVSSNFSNIAQCPRRPDHVLCFSCSEDQGVNCCCHYIFCNRCGDPYFSYNSEKEICLWRESNVFSCLFRSFVGMCQMFCLGGFALCQNSVKCFGYCSMICAQLICCKCSTEEFCENFSCLCFDCHKVRDVPEAMEESDLLVVSDCFKCACFLFKSNNISLFHDFVFEISALNPGSGSPEMSDECNADQGYTSTCGSGATMTLSNIHLEHNVHSYNAQSLHDVRSKNSEIPLGKLVSTPGGGFQRHVHETEVLHIIDEREQCSERSQESIECHARQNQKENGVMRTPSLNQSNLEEIEDSECEGESYLNVKHRQRLRENVLCVEQSKSTTDNKSEESKMIIPKRIQSANESNYKQKNRKMPDESRSPFSYKAKDSKTDILKSLNKYSNDYENNLHMSGELCSISNEVERSMEFKTKRAHFKDADSELVRGLFPRKVGKLSVDERRVHSKADDKFSKTETSQSDLGNISRKSKLRKTFRTQYDNSEEEYVMIKRPCKKMQTSSMIDHDEMDSGSGHGAKKDIKKKRQTKERSEETVDIRLTDYKSSDEEFGATGIPAQRSSVMQTKSKETHVDNNDIKVKSLDDMEDGRL